MHPRSRSGALRFKDTHGVKRRFRRIMLTTMRSYLQACDHRDSLSAISSYL